MSETLAKVGASEGCVSAGQHISRVLTFSKSCLTPSSVPRQPIQAAAQRLPAIREDSSGRYPAKATRDGVQKSPAQQRLWDNCQPRPQTQSILCFGAVFNKDHLMEGGVGLGVSGEEGDGPAGPGVFAPVSSLSST